LHHKTHSFWLGAIVRIGALAGIRHTSDCNFKDIGVLSFILPGAPFLVKTGHCGAEKVRLAADPIQQWVIAAADQDLVSANHHLVNKQPQPLATE